MQLTEAAYAGLGRELAAVRLPVLAILEGGYCTRVLGPCIAAFMGAFVEPGSSSFPDPTLEPRDTAILVARVKRLRDYVLGAWPSQGGPTFPHPESAPNTEVALCEAARRLGAGLEEVRAQASAARVSIDASFAFGASADGSAESTVDISDAAAAAARALHEAVDRAESTKTSALEDEVVAVDAALEELQSLAAACTAALSCPSPAGEASDALVVLVDRLVALRRRLEVLPRMPVEPCVIRLVSGSQESIGDRLPDLRILAPRALRARDFVVAPFPRTVRPGFPLHLSLEISPASAQCTHVDDADIALSAAVANTCVAARCVHLSQGGVSLPSPLVSVSYNASEKRIDIFLKAPEDMGVDIAFSIDGIYTAGNSILPSAPVLIPIRRSIAPGPLLHEGTHNLQTPCVTDDGIVIVPRDGDDTLHLFDSGGSALVGIPKELIVFDGPLISSAYCGKQDILVLSDCESVIALRFASRTHLWRRNEQRNCCGLAVLSEQGVAIVGSNSKGEISVYRLSDGTLLGAAPADGCLYVAADGASGAIFASTNSAISCFHWNGDMLVSDGRIESYTGSEALAVIPPAPGKTNSYLVTASRFKDTLQVCLT